MRKILFAVLSVLLLCSCESFRSDVTVCAHRGYHTTYKENSLDAFIDATQKGLEWAELDIWCTTDNHMVVTHDSNLRRVYGIDLDVTSVDFETLRISVSKQDVPELSDVWNEVKGKTKLQIEIKDDNAVPYVLDFFRTENCYDSCIVISFSKTSLENIKAGDSRITCGYLSSYYQPSMLDCKWADILCIDYKNVRKSHVNDAHKAGKQFYVWTVNEKKNFDKMVSFGVDGITTDRPLSF